MKNHGSKIAVFLLSFVIGIGFVWSLSLFINNAEVRPESEMKPEPEFETVVKKKQGNGLEVKFKEFVETENGSVADFEITNYESEPYFYHSYRQENALEPLSMLFQVKINGKEEKIYWCGTGLEAYELKPGETKIFRVWNVNSHWKKGKSIQFGFNFGKGSDKKYQTFWSEILPIDDSTAKRFLRE